jgi:hypothetical protein
MTERLRFDRRFTVMLPGTVADALEEQARLKSQKPAEFLRAAVAAALAGKAP